MAVADKGETTEVLAIRRADGESRTLAASLPRLVLDHARQLFVDPLVCFFPCPIRVYPAKLFSQLANRKFTHAIVNIVL